MSLNEYCAKSNCTNSVDHLCPPEMVLSYCSEDQFACIEEKNNKLLGCISGEKICDGNPDCSNELDERSCSSPIMFCKQHLIENIFKH